MSWYTQIRQFGLMRDHLYCLENVPIKNKILRAEVREAPNSAHQGANGMMAKTAWLREKHKIHRRCRVVKRLRERATAKRHLLNQKQVQHALSPTPRTLGWLTCTDSNVLCARESTVYSLDKKNRTVIARSVYPRVFAFLMWSEKGCCRIWQSIVSRLQTAELLYWALLHEKQMMATDDLKRRFPPSIRDIADR